MTVARFRLIAVAEAVTWLALIAATVARHGFGVEGATTAIGPVHGVIVLAYFAGVGLLREQLEWSSRRTLAAVVATVVPFGTLFVVRQVSESPVRPKGARP